MSVRFLLVCIFTLAICDSAAAQPANRQPADRGSANRKVVPVALRAVTPPSAGLGQTVTFRRRAAHVGDQTDQKLIVQTRMQSTLRHDEQVVEESSVNDARRQHRVVTTAQIAGGRSVAAQVRFLTAENVTGAGGQQEEIRRDPVVGRSYRCRREREQLLVTDERGDLPPLAEYEIVAGSMESLGQSNPLADFLAGQAVAVGQSITMPRELAEELFGLGDAINHVDQFQMTLLEINLTADRPSATFRTLLDASNHENGQMRMQLGGTLTVEIDGCRLIAAKLAGPIGMARSVMRPGGTMVLTGTGSLSVSIVSNYTDAR